MRNYTISMARSVRPAPVEIAYKHMRFLIIHNPDKQGMDYFIKELKKRDIKEVVRVCEPTYDTKLLEQEGLQVMVSYSQVIGVSCEPTYDTKLLEQEGLQVMDWAFDDGGVPSTEVIDKWVVLLKKRFAETPGSCVAVHCVAGLGRAPLLVALALMEAGMAYEDSVAFIREKRRGAINAKQLEYLEKYRPKLRLKPKKNNLACCIM